MRPSSSPDPERSRVPPALKLADFDVAALRRDLEVALGLHQAAQPGPYHNGGWKGVSLRSCSGNAETAAAGAPPFIRYRDTPLLSRTPYFRRVVTQLGLPMKGVRLLSLEPGGKIEAHRNPDLSLASPMARLHIPIETNPKVFVIFDGEKQHWQPGELWYGDFARPHWVVNDGETTRVHMVLDVYVTRRLIQMFPESYRSALRADGARLGGGLGRRLVLAANFGNHTFPAEESEFEADARA